ncbi:hypothetical protein DPMN_062758 [Dreissena polymorpha]|uniref:Uncharacterized protein n=1 Tax=Dreissena polymorpha TaxID=45954 RepID=A0A9D4CA35_DREPO|nr:hypothetical protein DPMN_062758 [Dreissena polymorpha]
MTENINGISSDIRIRDEKLETVNSFKYLGVIVTDTGLKPVILAKVRQTIVALTKQLSEEYPIDERNGEIWLLGHLWCPESRQDYWLSEVKMRFNQYFFKIACNDG